MITVSVFCIFTSVLMFAEEVTAGEEEFLSFAFLSLPPSLFPPRAFPLIQRGMQENHASVFTDDYRRQTDRAGRSRAAAVAGVDVNSSTQASSES